VFERNCDLKASITHYDAIVIGAGQAGGPLSMALAKAGRKTAIIERVHVGGSCINEGCSPSKTMIASARVAYLARRDADYGVRTGPVSVDMAKVRQRKQHIVDTFRNSSQHSLEQTEGLDLIFAEASFSGPKTLELHLNSGETRQLSADLIFINAGDRPAQLNIPGIDSVKTLDSTSIMELDTVPEHLITIGGGYISLEFGQMFRRFGSRVTLIERGPHLLSREDADVADEVAKILREDGIEVLLETKLVRVGQTSPSVIEVTVQTKDGERTLRGSHLLMAAGRVPNSDWLNLDAAGIKVDKRGYIQVNERLETNVPGVYALGDVKGGPAFTHISYDDFRIVQANLLEHGHASIKGRFVPYTIFIDPQLGRIGLSEHEAREQGYTIKVAKIPMSAVDRALEVDETRGFIKAVVDASTGQILGAAVLALEGGEIMAMLEIAMMGKLPYTALRDGTFAHPTLAESLNTLFSSIE
jgi:pyruvate/2-oxoglutarate dehydrogenase complex dihydrolipoamide dehydrogenase (E3) component